MAKGDDVVFGVKKVLGTMDAKILLQDGEEVGSGGGGGGIEFPVEEISVEHDENGDIYSWSLKYDSLNACITETISEFGHIISVSGDNNFWSITVYDDEGNSKCDVFVDVNGFQVFGVFSIAAVGGNASSKTALGDDQISAAIISSNFVKITSAGSGTGVRFSENLPAGTKVDIWNATENQVAVYPPSGGSIDGGVTDAADTNLLNQSTVRSYVHEGSGSWITWGYEQVGGPV